MANVHTAMNGEKLIVTIDLSAKAIQSAERSKTGKSRVVASTGGFLPISTAAGNVSLNLSLITKN